MDLPLVWFGLVGVLLMGYAILDGFDFGVGILHLWLRDETQRRLALNSIGPLWDGNEVWLVTFGGALFGAFPQAYAALFSGFYLPVMLVLFALIGRAISLEFRGKLDHPRWRAWWDGSFFLSSASATFGFGLLLGNVVQGVPLGPGGEYRGTLADLLRPYPIAVGVLALATAAMHGSIYLHLKTEGALQQRVRGWMMRSFVIFAIAWLVVTVGAVLAIPHATAALRRWPAAWVLVVLHVLAIANIPRAIMAGRSGVAFVSSCCTIAAMTSLVALALYPELVHSSLDPAWGLELHAAAASDGTLGRMLLIAILGMPLVATYTAIVYWVFRGKVKLDASSY
ncbi:MAG: cytochrome d ubiquinol oxidase subunit II [Nannocystaceae bacterium]|nr:cytochrome d ubiquinol oxidase subunit II [Nannocystaceae bacterium]